MRGRPAVLTCLVALCLVLASCTSDDSSSAASTAAAAASTTAAAPLTVSAVAVTPNPNSTVSVSLAFTTSAPATVDLHIVGPGSIAPRRRRPNPRPTTRSLQSGCAELALYVDGHGDRRQRADRDRGPCDVHHGCPSHRHPDVHRDERPDEDGAGITLFPVTKRAVPVAVAGQPAPNLGLLVGVDPEGSIVWYYEAPSPIGDARMLPNGHILYEYNDMGVRRDRRARQRRARVGWAPRARTARHRRLRPHHRRTERDPGRRRFDAPRDPPDARRQPHHAQHRAAPGQWVHQADVRRDTGQVHRQLSALSDVVVEFEPDTGKVVHEWHLADYFHPQTNPAD